MAALDWLRRQVEHRLFPYELLQGLFKAGARGQNADIAGLADEIAIELWFAETLIARAWDDAQERAAILGALNGDAVDQRVEFLDAELRGRHDEAIWPEPTDKPRDKGTMERLAVALVRRAFHPESPPLLLEDPSRIYTRLLTPAFRAQHDAIWASLTPRQHEEWRRLKESVLLEPPGGVARQHGRAR